MTDTADTVRDRIDLARHQFRPTQMALALAFVAAIGFVLLFMQDPMVHDSLHNFRHAAGITCH